MSGDVQSDAVSRGLGAQGSLNEKTYSMLIVLLILGPIVGFVSFIALFLAGVSTGYAVLIAWLSGIFATFLVVMIVGRVDLRDLIQDIRPAPRRRSSVRTRDDST